MSNTGDFRRKNTKFTGTEGILTPKGTSAERGGMPAQGTLRYNTELGFMEQYNVTGWAGIDAPPTVSNFSGVLYSATDSVITVNGSNFKSGSSVVITGGAVNNVDRALSTTFVNSGQLTAQTNAASVNFLAGQSYNIKVVNPSGLSAVLEPAGTIDSPANWQTAQGTLATIADAYDDYTSIATLSATDPDGDSITYSEVGNTLANKGISISSAGVISGDPNNNSGAAETVTFTGGATSNGQTQTRSFNIIVNPAPDGSTAARAGFNAASIKALTGTTTNGNYWIKHASLNSGNAFQIYADMNKSQGGNWFSPGYFGIEPTNEYKVQNNATYTKIKFRRLDTNTYDWWFMICGGSSPNWTPIYAAQIRVPSGGSVGDDLEADLRTDPITEVGSRTIPSSGNYYISWLSSNADGSNAPSQSIYNDTGGSRGATEYVPHPTTDAPTTSYTYTTTSQNTGYRIHITATCFYNGVFIKTGHPSWRGGWTLIHSNQATNGVDWNNSNILGLNQTSPNLNSGAYSILSWAPTIRSQDSTYWVYLMEANSDTTRGNYGGIIHASTSDSFQDSTPRTGNYYRQETLPNSAFQGANDSGDTCYDRVLWINQGGYSPHPSALLTTYPGTPNWWGTLTEGGSSRGYGCAPYMNSAGLGTPSYTWLWVK